MVSSTRPFQRVAELPISFDFRVASDGHCAYIESDACGGKIFGVRPKVARALALNMLQAADEIEAAERT